MGLVEDETDRERASRGARRQLKEKALADGAEAARREGERTGASQARLPRWEYQVMRVGEQKGLIGAKRMEDTLNREGSNGWELVAINGGRATFKRQLPPSV